MVAVAAVVAVVADVAVAALPLMLIAQVDGGDVSTTMFPLVAGRTLAGPLGTLIAAVGAKKCGFHFRHGVKLRAAAVQKSVSVVSGSKEVVGR